MTVKGYAQHHWRMRRTRGDLSPTQLAVLLNLPTALFMVAVLAYPTASSL